MNSTNQFYARLTPFYHLIYPNWEACMHRQAGMLASVIREMWGDISTILDVSCGIGTKANRGHRTMRKSQDKRDIVSARVITE